MKATVVETAAPGRVVLIFFTASLLILVCGRSYATPLACQIGTTTTTFSCLRHEPDQRSENRYECGERWCSGYTLLPRSATRWFSVTLGNAPDPSYDTVLLVPDGARIVEARVVPSITYPPRSSVMSWTASLLSPPNRVLIRRKDYPAKPVLGQFDIGITATSSSPHHCPTQFIPVGFDKTTDTNDSIVVALTASYRIALVDLRTGKTKVPVRVLQDNGYTIWFTFQQQGKRMSKLVARMRSIDSRKTQNVPLCLDLDSGRTGNRRQPAGASAATNATNEQEH
jgi:hypothetical protein